MQTHFKIIDFRIKVNFEKLNDKNLKVSQLIYRLSKIVCATLNHLFNLRNLI